MATSIPSELRPTDTTIAEGRAALFALRAGGRHEQFLDQGYRYLETVADDPPVAAEVLKALVEAGLGVPARELLQQRADLAPLRDGPGGLARALLPVPAGRVPWEACAERFEANLAAMLAGRPHLEDLAEPLRAALSGCQLFEASDGTLHLSRRATGGLRRWVPAFHDPARTMVDQLPLGPDSPPVAVVGTGLTVLLERVYLATRSTDGPGTVPLFVIDDTLDRFAAWLHAAHRTALLKDPRVCVFIGPEALTRFERYLADNEDIALPETHLSMPWARDLGREVVRVAREAATRRGAAMAKLVEQHRRRAAERSIGDSAQRFVPGATVLGFTSRTTTMLQYSMRDIGHAFESLGYRFRLVIEQEPHRGHSTLTTSRAVWDADPALVVLINHFRREQPHAMGAVPLLTWIQDPTDLVLSRQTGASIGPLDFVCGYYQQRCTEEFGYPASRFFSAPLPVSQRIFHDEPVPAAEAAQYACDVMYVGHLHETAEQHLARWQSIVPPDRHPLLDRLRREVVAFHDRGEHLSLRDAHRLTGETAAAMNSSLEPGSLEQLAGYFTFRLFDIMFRRQTLLWAAAWAERTGRTLRLYGRGWASDPQLARYAVGPIEHGEPLRRAYRCAPLTLQTIPGGFEHQRAFEALLSGSLAIGRFIPPDFERGSAQRFPLLEHVVFRNADEWAQVAESLLSDAGRRQALQSDFADVVRRRFTYAGVVRGLLEKMHGAMAPRNGMASPPR